MFPKYLFTETNRFRLVMSIRSVLTMFHSLGDLREDQSVVFIAKVWALLDVIACKPLINVFQDENGEQR